MIARAVASLSLARPAGSPMHPPGASHVGNAPRGLHPCVAAARARGSRLAPGVRRCFANDQNNFFRRS